MKYLVYGKDEEMIRFRISQIKNDPKEELMEFDTKTDDSQDVIMEVLSQSLFDDVKTVVLHNADFIRTTKKSEDYKQSDFLNLEYPANKLILLVSEKPTAAMIKKLEQSGYEIISAVSFDQPEKQKMIEDFCRQEKIQLSFKARKWIEENLTPSPYYLLNELKKISLYSKKPSMEELEELCIPAPESNIFKLTDAFFDRNAGEFIRLYRLFRRQGMEAQAVIGLLASQIRFLFQVCVLIEKRMDNDEIARKLSVSSGRVYYSRKRARGFRSLQLLGVLSDLSELDQRIKNGQLDKDTGVETFVLQQFREF